MHGLDWAFAPLYTIFDCVARKGFFFFSIYFCEENDANKLPKYHIIFVY